MKHMLAARGGRRAAILIGAAVVFGLAGGLFASLQSRVYESEFVLMVSGRTTDQTTAPQQAFDISQLSIARAETYARLLNSSTVTSAVVADLHLESTPAGVHNQVKATPVTGTNLIDVTVGAGSPAQAHREADALAKNFATFTQGMEQAQSPGSEPVLYVSTAVPPSIPLQASSPKIVTTGLLASALGVALALMAVLWASAHETTGLHAAIEIGPRADPVAASRR